MDSAVLNQKSLQRPQTHDNLNGPRVSFNKDVHVKRIGNKHLLKRKKNKIRQQQNNEI